MNEQELIEILSHWTKILSLKHENIGYLEEPSDLIAEPIARVTYDPEKKYWIIAYNKNTSQQSIIHELGHIYLYKLLNHIDIKRSVSEKIEKIIDPEIRTFKQALLDCFVDFRMCQFEEYSKLYIEERIIFLNSSFKDPNSIPFFEVLRFYLLFYVICNYIFPESIKDQYNNKIKTYLRYLKKQVIMSSKGTEKPLTQKIFIKLNHILDKFDTIKETNNIEDIINYFYEILKVFSYWDNEYILKQLNIIFKRRTHV